MSENAPLQPMVTYLHGPAFRSRLEARWALFLDALGVSWSYEEEWFLLLGTGYTPDFRLTGYPRTWLEVKPEGIEVDESRYREFARRGERLILCVGTPWPSEYQDTLFVGDQREAGLAFALGRTNHAEIWLMREYPEPWAVPLPSHVTGGEHWPMMHCHRLREAYAHARSFEFWTPK
jgi:hypothetical protein